MTTILYPATARMLTEARQTGFLDPAAAMHTYQWVVLHIALVYASREDQGLPPINTGFYIDDGADRLWSRLESGRPAASVASSPMWQPEEPQQPSNDADNEEDKLAYEHAMRALDQQPMC